MGKVVLVVRVLMGASLIVFGLNYFMGFLEPPTEFPAKAQGFIDALDSAEYLLPVKSGVEVAAGVFLLTGLFVPLGLVIFAPILVNIVGFHLYLTPPFPDGVVGFVLLAFELFLAWAYAGSFRGVLSMTAGSRYKHKPA